MTEKTLTVFGMIDSKSIIYSDDRLTFSLSNYSHPVSVISSCKDDILSDIQNRPVVKGCFKGIVRERFETIGRITKKFIELDIREYTGI